MEDKINEMLRETLKLHFSLKKHKREEEAYLVLRIGSLMADTLLALSDIKNEKVLCPLCHGQVRRGWQISFLKETGRCIHCDHLEGDRL